MKNHLPSSIIGVIAAISLSTTVFAVNNFSKSPVYLLNATNSLCTQWGTQCNSNVISGVTIGTWAEISGAKTLESIPVGMEDPTTRYKIGSTKIAYVEAEAFAPWSDLWFHITDAKKNAVYEIYSYKKAGTYFLGWKRDY